MNKLLCRLACVAAFCLATSAQAGVLTFNPPVEQITIDDNTFVATYPEGGFRITGVAASFLPLDNNGAGGTGGLFVSANSPIVLMAAGSGLFSLLGLDFAAVDPFGVGLDPSASLMVSGLVNGGGLLEQTLPLDNLGFKSFSFQSWDNLTQVRFAANADFVLDNINVVPEPASLALVGVALAGLALSWRGRRAAFTEGIFPRTSTASLNARPTKVG
jgi:hypothetical protein